MTINFINCHVLSTVAPTALKSALGWFSPQFVGFNQHDSQELLAVLLDGLHEDLNRIRKKPAYQAAPDCFTTELKV
jgi:ubiquitin carboxyl-terminal hydrolase 4/11/15